MYCKASLLILNILLLLNSVFAQQEIITQSEVTEVFENQAVTIKFELSQEYEIQQAFLYYRTFGKAEISIIEMNIQGKTISATIPPDYVLFPFIEYYLKILTTNGKVITYPYQATETGNYVRINIKKREQINEQIIVLSPSLDEPITREEFFLALSLLRVSSVVKKEFTRVWINDNEVTSLILYSEDLIILPQGSVKNLPIGFINLKVILYDSTNRPFSISNFNFNVVTKQVKENITAKRFSYGGELRIESNYENMRIGNFNYNRILTSFSSRYGKFSSNVNIFVTNEEKPSLQPQNRFFLSLDAEFLKLFIGDHNPVYPNLIMNGKRLRGITGSLELGFFNIQASYGEVLRRVEGELLQLYSRDSVVLSSELIPIDSSKFGQPFARVKVGTYQRKLFVIRPYFGKGQNFQLGFTYMHSKDEMNSIEFGARPKENVVLGSDLTIGIDNKRVLFKAQGAFSLFNNDISTGNFTDKLIDSLFGKGKPLGGDPDFIKKVRDIGKNFITINQFISPLNPKELPTLAADVMFSLNYFGNYFISTYMYRGNDYTSFGQSFLRNDIKGFQIMDRIGLFENRIFISVSYENLNDNLQKTKITTTTFRNIEGSVALYLRRDFPNLTFNYSNYRVNNDIDPFTADSIRLLSYVNDETNQFSFSANYNLQLNVLHRIFLNIVSSQKKDYTPKKLSAKFISLNFSVQNFWNKNLTTLFSVTTSNSELVNSKYNYLSISAGVRLNSFNDKLRSTFSLNPSFGNLKRTLIDLSNQYLIIQNLSLNLGLRFLFNPKPLKNESILNFFARYNF